MSRSNNKVLEVITSTDTEVLPSTTSEVIPPVVLDDKHYYGKYGNVSQTIRGMTAEGFSRGTIAKILGKRYQHVRNVLVTPLKKN